MAPRFPRRRTDGSFCVDVAFDLRGEPQTAGSRAEEWLKEWVGENRVWPMRRLSTGGARMERYDYMDDFLGAPCVVVAPDSVILRFEGKPGARKWKDWVARIITELSRDVPEMGEVKSILNCEDTA